MTKKQTPKTIAKRLTEAMAELDAKDFAKTADVEAILSPAAGLAKLRWKGKSKKEKSAHAKKMAAARWKGKAKK